MNLDPELVRKAAEALHNEFQRGARPFTPFSGLSERYKQDWDRKAEVALKVFYEHTHAQTRERAPRVCEDCGATMIESVTTPGLHACPDCGKTSRIA